MNVFPPLSVFHCLASGFVSVAAQRLHGSSLALLPAVLGLCFSMACLSGCRAPLPSAVQPVAASGKTITVLQPASAQQAGQHAWRLVTKNRQQLWQTQEPAGRYGGSLQLATIGQGPKTFNPWVAMDATSSSVASYLLAGLLDTNPDTGEVRPWLASQVQVLPDGCTYRVTLRQGLTWSDGRPLTSSDVLFTWNTIIKQGLGNPSTKSIVTVNGQFPVVTAPNAHTVVFKTAVPFAPFLRSLGTPIAPKHVFEPIIAKKADQKRGQKIEQGGDAAFQASWTSQLAAEHPERFVSSGLWLLERYEPDQRVVFKRNPRAHLLNAKGQALPYLNQVVLTFVKDTNNLQLQFEQGAVDVYSPPPNYVSRLRQLKQPAFSLFNLGPAETTTFFVFNLHPGTDAATKKPLVPPRVARWFARQGFRKALDYALDRDLMVETILKGVGSPLFTSESPKSLYVNHQLAKGFAKNLPKAKALLRQEGFTWSTQNGTKGLLLDPLDKQPVRFSLLTNAGNEIREASGLAVQQDLAELGITVEFKAVEFNSLLNRMQQGHWESIILGLSGGDPFEPHFSANVWKSDAPLHLFYQRQPGQLAKYPPLPWEQEIDNLFEQGAQVLNAQQRQPFYYRYQAILAEQAPLLYLYSPQSIVAIRKRVRNARPTLLGGGLHNLPALWLAGSG